MKNKIILSIAFVTVAILSYYWFNNKQISTAAPGEKTQPTSSLAKEVLSKPLTPEQQAVVKNNSTTAAECSQFSEQVNTKHLGNLLEDFVADRIQIPISCLKDENLWTVKIRLSLTEACHKQDLKNKDKMAWCYLALMKLKAHYLLQGVRLDDLNSMTFDQLVARLFDVFVNESDSIENQYELLKLTSELDQRAPDNKTIKKLHAMAQLFDTLNHGPPLNPKQVDDFFRTVNMASQMNPADWQVYEMKLFMLTRTNVEEARKLANQLSQQYPKIGLGPYYLSGIAWRNDKNREKAREYALEALKREPQIGRFKKTYNRMETADLSEPVFEISIGFDPANL